MTVPILSFRSWGDGVEPLIIVHGLFGSGDNWQTVAQELSCGDRRVITPDLRNHGRSFHDDCMDFGAMAGDLLALADHLHLTHFDLAGHSLGAKVALSVLGQAPRRVNKVILLDMANRAYSPVHASLFEALFSLNPADFNRRAAIDKALAEKVASPAVRAFLVKNVYREKAGRFCWRFNLNALAANYRQLGDAVAVRRDLQREVLVLHGGKSDYVTEQDIVDMRQIFPRLKDRLIPQAGHWLHADNRGAVVGLIREFLA